MKNLRHPKGYWKNKENIINEAKKYHTKEEFKRGNLKKQEKPDSKFRRFYADTMKNV